MIKNFVEMKILDQYSSGFVALLHTVFQFYFLASESKVFFFFLFYYIDLFFNIV